ncbi:MULTISPECIES: fimbrial protein [unclassified Serratia (in: enterobacteria)]|uniref:fimbrial protein n=1 Tax=unclassified Serratia (in: enterobacteria) TaxID=2647522 RepID=UPI000469F1A7|nr:MULTISPECIES: type 1 fimbrial protein [unclassified Serratia (in: enterobacteria)]
MRKNLLTLTPAALLLLAVAGGAQAASNAQITITGTVVAATCDVSLSTNNLDLGNYTPAQFTGVATPIPASQHPFTVGLSNCQTPLAASDAAGLVVTGQTLAGNTNMFNTTGTNTGVMLRQASAPAGTYISNGDKLTVATAGTTPSAADFNGQTLSLTAGLASTSTTGVNIGAVNAPILFSFAYN